MAEIYDVTPENLLKVSTVGIALALNGKHAGLCYEFDGVHKLLHLAFHRDLRSEQITSEYAIVVPDLEVEDGDILVAFAEAVWEMNKNEKILFGFGSPEDVFDLDASNYLYGGQAIGLTCASFVLAVFHRAMLPLVEYKSWTASRPRGTVWHEHIVGILRRQYAFDDEHIRKVEQMVPAVRFRPEEVAASGLQSHATRFDCIPSLLSVLCNKSSVVLADYY